MRDLRPKGCYQNVRLFGHQISYIAKSNAVRDFRDNCFELPGSHAHTIQGKIWVQPDDKLAGRFTCVMMARADLKKTARLGALCRNVSKPTLALIPEMSVVLGSVIGRESLVRSS